MKRMKRILTAYLLLAVGALGLLCLGACGSRGMVGSYYFESLRIEEDGVARVYRIGDTLPWGVVATKDVRTVRIKSDGSVLLRLQEDRDGAPGIWETIKGEPDKIVITFEDEDPLVCECDGSTLTIRDDTTVMVFKK